MSRRFWKRAALAIVAGTSLAAGALPAADKDAAASYQPNDVIVLKSPGRADQKVTVLRSTRRADGRVYTEVKDSTGKVFTMIDEAPNGALDRGQGVIAAGLKDMVKPKETAAAPPDSAVAMADKRRRLFGRDDDEPRSAPPPAPAPEPEKEKKPGLLGRLFGRDKDKDEKPSQMTQQPRQPYTPQPAYTPQLPPQPPVAMTPTYPTYPTPVPTTPNPMPLVVTPPSNPVIPGVPAQMPSTGLAPWTQVRSPEPTPPAGVPPVKPTPGVTTGTTRINLTPDIPRPTTPPVTAPVVNPPSVVIPQAPPATVPIAPPVTVPAVPIAPPVAVPFPPQVSIPALPAPAPNKQSLAKPAASPGLRTVSHVETREEIVVLSEVKSEVEILRNSRSAAERLIAVRSLANGRYGSRSEVKGVLFETARRDSAPAVCAQCITELRELGYYDANFLMFLEDCDSSPDAEVRDAAKSALAKLDPKK